MTFCRACNRWGVDNEPAGRAVCGLAAVHFWLYHGYWPHFSPPRTFEEKVSARMLFDRNVLWTTFCDKWRARVYVAERGYARHLVPVLWHGSDPSSIALDALPSRFVVKATHGCGYNIIVMDKATVDPHALRKQLTRWMERNYCRDESIGTSWAYLNIPPGIVIEEFIGKDGNVPVDYKFFCFSGRAEYVLLSFDRYGAHSKLIVDRDFRPTRVQRGHQRYAGAVSPPPGYETMLEIAETLAMGIDMIRVDLYNVDGRIYFGEMTCYPGGGMIPFDPRSEDFAWGAKWNMAPPVVAGPPIRQADTSPP